MDKPSGKPPKPSVPELRVDPIKGFTVMLAPQRLERPGAIRLHPWPEDDRSACPFCPGKEHLVPNPVRRFPDEGHWRIKIVPNKYPFCLDSAEQSNASSTPAVGVHEVVIESAEHIRSWTQLSPTDVGDILGLVQWRMRKLQQSQRYRLGIFFKNYGPSAGASLIHAHSQIVGLPQVPEQIERQLAAAEDYQRASSGCFLCDRLQDASAHPLIHESPHFRLLCPRVSRFAYETWVVPLRHRSHFEQATSTEITDLAQVLHAHLARLEQALPQVCYNLALQSAPFDRPPNDHYHWHVEVYPRIAHLAGFELLAGHYINSVDPMNAAKSLQAAR